MDFYTNPWFYATAIAVVAWLFHARKLEALSNFYTGSVVIYKKDYSEVINCMSQAKQENNHCVVMLQGVKAFLFARFIKASFDSSKVAVFSGIYLST